MAAKESRQQQDQQAKAMKSFLRKGPLSQEQEREVRENNTILKAAAFGLCLNGCCALYLDKEGDALVPFVSMGVWCAYYWVSSLNLWRFCEGGLI